MVEKIIEILSKVKDDASLLGTLDGSSNIISGVGLDSLQMINFVLELEDEFNIEIDFDQFDLKNLQSITAVCKVIEGAMKERQTER
jgi:acyl carrier protein